ncbi:hypothetical protein [Bradyrhizobium sp. Tv2a-2]|uniref:hypothetical protein n=1 Tax=Bradyrhizobium sp. Tv2a-2 TaxID=113395 RepID=UPI000401AC49|nr:hypothetical protein [Bradyrhizobium sp. Tv2a-2]
MPQTFLDGQENLAALTVPGEYTDIILPQPQIVGTPTNIEGLVGVGSWGIVGAQIPGSTPNDVALSVGPPVVRAYDLASYVAASSQVGGSIGYIMIRVSDGTDTAASATLGGVLLTAKCTGILGNQIRASIQNASLANSYMGVVSFPGKQPEQFNNVLGPVPASATATFTGQPAANDTLTIGGTAITFVTSAPTGTQVQIGTSVPVTLSNLLSFCLSSQDTNLIKFTYSVAGGSNALTITANQFVNSGAQSGVGGNALTLAKTSTNITVSGATLSGGSGTWQTFWNNLANVINSGNFYSPGPSSCVVATAQTSTLPPTLSSPVTLTGGTDGASGVTDATLIGQDISPRKGMYMLRSSGCDSFTLCDLVTSSYYSAIVSFGLSENMLPIVGTVSGDTISNATATRINSGVDSPWLWLIMGDYPSFYDNYNQVTRVINPAAFGIGIAGNLSPQESPLNKQLLGVTATQRVSLGQPYSMTELSLINTGGIDAILGPAQSPGGNYFSFASGRNVSSNNSANGVEYTRMTNWLARAAQSKAAGSFIGQLQSIQPNDQTRENAKALFDGFSAQLASPQVGLGIGGQGMIDAPWKVICDSSNNPAPMQARGYLFLYWEVRYLNVVRYFVVKFMGGGNVVVTSSSTSFSDAAALNAQTTISS